MAIPTTLLAYHAQRGKHYSDDKTNAEKRLRDIQLTTLPAARKTSDDLAKAAGDLTQKIATLRQAIAQAATKADADGLTLQLEKALVDLRSNAAGQAEAQRQINALTDAQTSLGAAINSLTPAIAAANTAADAAALREKQIKAATDAFGKEPLKSLGTGVTTALAAVAAADTRVKADVPAALLTRALERRQTAVQALKDVNAAAAAAQALSGSNLQQSSIQADAALFAFVAQAVSRLDVSTASLALVTNPATAPLTAEEKARLADATLVADAAKALGPEKDRDDAQLALNVKQALLDDAILQAKNTDIDVDLTTVKAVKDAVKDRDDAKKTLDTAVLALTSTMRDDLHRWESALPQANWDLVHQLEEARATLNELNTSSMAALTAAITAAETAWTAALYAGDQKDRTGRWIDGQAKSRAAAQEFEVNANRARRLTALRGDQ